MVEKIIWIGPQKVDCIGVGPQQCYQLKEKEDDDWTLFYDEIEGFMYQPGYTYRLKVWQEEIANPPADGSSWKYVLVEQLEKTAVAGVDNRLHDIWVVTTMEGQPLPPEGHRPRLELFPVEERLGGSGGCNSIFGSFKVNGDQINFSEIGATKMFCAGLMKQEGQFLKLLQEVTHYELRGLQLLLLKDGEIMMHLQKVD